MTVGRPKTSRRSEHIHPHCKSSTATAGSQGIGGGALDPLPFTPLCFLSPDMSSLALVPRGLRDRFRFERPAGIKSAVVPAASFFERVGVRSEVRDRGGCRLRLGVLQPDCGIARPVRFAPCSPPKPRPACVMAHDAARNFARRIVHFGPRTLAGHPTLRVRATDSSRRQSQAHMNERRQAGAARQ